MSDSQRTKSILLNQAETKISDEDVLVIPTTLAQKRFWEYDRENPGNPAYNIAIRIRLSGRFLPPIMERAANELIRRHEMLRTIFEDQDGQPVQVVLPHLSIQLQHIDLRDIPVESQPAKVEELSRNEAHYRFHLSTPPLLRFTLVRLEENNHILLLTVHQTVSDCWSIGIVSHELAVLYRAYSQGQESPLPELPVQYGDYAIWQRQWLENHGLGTQLAYWTRQLANLPILGVKSDRPRPPHRTFNGHIQSRLLPKELTESLKDLSHREGYTFFMLSLAAVKVLLLRLTGQTDIPVGTITAGRLRVEMEPLVGRFINPLVIRSKLSNELTFINLLRRVGDGTIEALENRDIPYECVVEAIRPESDPSLHPVFQVNFVHQRAFVRPMEMSDLSFSGIPSMSAGAIYDLYFFMVERPEGWRLSCEYNSDLFENATIERMLDHFNAILEGVASDPTRRLSDLPSISSLTHNAPHLIPKQNTNLQSMRLFINPRSETETRLAKLWCQVIRSERVSVDSDFFDEGGHSVLAVRLLYLIQKEFGESISIGAFLKAPTIEKFAKRLGAKDVEGWKDQVEIHNPEGTLPALVIIDPGTRYRKLYDQFGTDQPIIALSLPVSQNLPANFRVEDLAENLVNVLLEVRPRGPYCLTGWCAAGVVAYEMAQQLQARSEQVPLVALLDSWNPVYGRFLRSWSGLPVKLNIRLHKNLFHLHNLRGKGVKQILDYLGKRRNAVRDQLKRKFWHFWYRRMKRPIRDNVVERGDFKLLAVVDYVPKPIDSKTAATRHGDSLPMSIS